MDLESMNLEFSPTAVMCACQTLTGRAEMHDLSDESYDRESRYSCTGGMPVDAVNARTATKS